MKEEKVNMEKEFSDIVTEKQKYLEELEKKKAGN